MAKPFLIKMKDPATGKVYDLMERPQVPFTPRNGVNGYRYAKPAKPRTPSVIKKKLS